MRQVNPFEANQQFIFLLIYFSCQFYILFCYFNGDIIAYIPTANNFVFLFNSFDHDQWMSYNLPPARNSG